MDKLKKLGGGTVFKVMRIIFGGLVAGAAMSFITLPNDVVSGGITGIAQILHRLINTPIGIMTIILNIPLFILAWKKLGKWFVIGSLISMVTVSVSVDLFAMVDWKLTDDKLLAAVYGGVIQGFGMGVVYSAGVTNGGTDILARIFKKKYPHMNFGIISLGFSGVVVLAFAIIFKKYDSCMYTVICMFIHSKVVDLMLYGPVTARMCHIISAKHKKLKEEITSHLGRGVTLLHGQGAWSGEEKDVILCVVKNNQIASLRKLVREVDPQAFFIISEARGVYGFGFESINSDK